MTEQSYNLNFEGYWRYINRGGVPKSSGVYCVYTSIYNEQKKTITLNKLIYIGESENVNERLQNHEKEDYWKKHLKANEILSFSCAKVESSYRERTEAALIFKHKPPVNTEYVTSFPFDTTTIKSNGETALLNPSFTVYRT